MQDTKGGSQGTLPFAQELSNLKEVFTNQTLGENVSFLDFGVNLFQSKIARKPFLLSVREKLADKVTFDSNVFGATGHHRCSGDGDATVVVFKDVRLDQRLSL